MIAIFIPYRNRKDHLDKLLESLNYPNISIHVLEQDNNDLFNRGKLFNIGAKEYLDKYEYLIFHDVDLIPQDADYNCKPTTPTHYSCFCEQFGYKLFDVEESEYLKSQMFGGVIAMKKKDFIKCNGYSNIYEGWGCEDNDLFERVIKQIGSFTRKPWKYNSQPHPSSYDSELNPNLYNNLNYLKSNTKNTKKDGVTQLKKINIPEFKTHLEYTFETIQDQIRSNIYYHKINFDCYYKKKNIITIYINELKESLVRTIINFAFNEKKSVLITSSILSIPPDLKYFYLTSNKSYLLKTYKIETNEIIKSWVEKQQSISTVDSVVSYLIDWSDLEKIIHNNYNYSSINYYEEIIEKHLTFDKFDIVTNKFINLSYITPIISKTTLSTDDNNIINVRTQNLFNYYIYYILNNDLQKSIGLYEHQLTNHFITRGLYETRCINNNIPDDFDPYGYYQLNPDLKFIELNIMDLTKHYMTNGRSEEREYDVKTEYKIKNIDWDYFKYLYPSIDDDKVINYWLENKDNIQTPLIKYTLTYKNENSIIKTKTLILTHHGGGGVEKYLNLLIDHISDYIILKPNCDKCNIFEIKENKIETKYFYESQINEIVDYILKFNIDKIIINHFSAFTPQFFQMCIQIKNLFKIKIYTIIHDYSFFSNIPNLTCDEISSLYYSLCNSYYITRYTFLKNINTIIFPSEYIKNVFVSFTNISSEINIIKSFHPDINYISPDIITNISNKPEFKIVIIGFNKGYDQIIDFVTNCTNSNIKIIVLGSKVSHPSIQVYLETYDDSDIEKIFDEIKPNLIWFPSKVPETYCYALSHSIKLGYPIVAYNIGAFTERLIGRPATWLLDLSDSLENKIDEIISSYEDAIISCSDYIESYNHNIPKDYFNYFV